MSQNSPLQSAKRIFNGQKTFSILRSIIDNFRVADADVSHSDQLDTEFRNRCNQQHIEIKREVL